MSRGLSMLFSSRGFWLDPSLRLHGSRLSFGYGQMVGFCYAFVFDLIGRGRPGAILMNEWEEGSVLWAALHDLTQKYEGNCGFLSWDDDEEGAKIQLKSHNWYILGLFYIMSKSMLVIYTQATKTNTQSWACLSDYCIISHEYLLSFFTVFTVFARHARGCAVCLCVQTAGNLTVYILDVHTHDKAIKQ